jgi:Amt family ammonium transporter
MSTEIQDLNISAIPFADAPSSSSPSNFLPGDSAWTLVSTAMVWLMIPGVGFLYCGMARSKSALSLLTLCMWSTAIVSVQWFLFGYSLTFSSKGNEIIGYFDKALFLTVGAEANDANPRISEILFSIYQGMFAAITPALVIGSTAERGRFLPTLVFMFFWTTFVYDFIAYWTWGPNGWFCVMGGLDFAGGLPVHLSSGVSAAVYAWLLEERQDSIKEAKPHNIVLVILGTALIWFGYFGFNGASAMGANARAAIVVCNTNLSASIAGITWALLDYRRDKKFSSLAFCFGAIAGLVTVTPASGFIIPAYSLVFGVIGAIGCRAAVQIKKLISFDDALDVLAVHGVGGLLGTILVGVFAEKEITATDGLSSIEGGWIEGHWWQIVVQLAGCGATIAWSILVTFIILFIMNKIPGLRLRVNSRTEGSGIDSMQLGETAYEEYGPVPTHMSQALGAGGRRRSSLAAGLHFIKKIAVDD